jgi:putative transcriptional regulator
MFVEILQNKNAATRFQVMVEIAASGPRIPQKTIAQKLGVTPQAISDYVHQLVEEDLVISSGRSNYSISTKGTNWILSILRELRGYIGAVEKAVTNISVCAAIAASDIEPGQAVGLTMKNGLLMATAEISGDARGVAVSRARQGDDVDITRVVGLIELTRGTVTILQIPAIQRGGSKLVNLEKLKSSVIGGTELGAIGIEALVALRHINVEPRYFYGVAEAAVEAAQCGLDFCIVCTDDAVPEVIRKLQEKNLDYSLAELRQQNRRKS